MNFCVFLSMLRIGLWLPKHFSNLLETIKNLLLFHQRINSRKYEHASGNSFSLAQQPKSGLRCPIFEVPRSHNWHTAGSIPLTEWSAHRRCRYLRSKQQTQETTMSSEGFIPAIPTTKRSETYANTHTHTLTIFPELEAAINLLQWWRRCSPWKHSLGNNFVSP
jgi:hypothetical protein